MKEETLNLENYNKNDLFWRDFVSLPDSPYRLEKDLNGFNCLFVFMTKEGNYSGWDYPISFGYMASLIRMNKGSATISIKDNVSYNKKDYEGYDLICFYPMAALLQDVLKQAEQVKEDYPAATICFFNSDQHQHEMMLCVPGAQEFAQNLMKEYPFIDLALIGEAEYSFIRLCSELATKHNRFSEIPACIYRENELVSMSKLPIKKVNFDYLPFPSRDLLEGGIVNGVNIRAPRVQSSRGCMSGCTYCVESWSNILAGGRKMPVLFRDIIKFVDEIELLSRHYKIIFFNIIDSSFEDPGMKGIRRMKIFFQEIIKRNIPSSFKVHMRFETVKKLDDDYWKMVKEAGVDVIIGGAESGLDHELRSYNKITTVQQNLEAIRIIEESGKFFVLLGYMMFSPVLKLEDIPEKVAFIKKVHHGWDYLNMSNNLLVFRGTAYHKSIESQGLAMPADPLSPVIPYRYKDERVRFLANEMGKLKQRCPEVIMLHNLLYNIMNILSRYYNRMNQHLWQNKEGYYAFKENVSKVFERVEEAYCNYLLQLVGLARSGWTSEKADKIY